MGHFHKSITSNHNCPESQEGAVPSSSELRIEFPNHMMDK